MAQTIEFYEDRAEEAAEEARNATLMNVRDRALRSEAAWRTMANRARVIAEGKARKAEEQIIMAEANSQA